MRVAVQSTLISLGICLMFCSCTRKPSAFSTSSTVWKESIQDALKEDEFAGEVHASGSGDSWQFAITEGSGRANALAAKVLERFIVKSNGLGMQPRVVSVQGTRGKSVNHSIIDCKNEKFVLTSGTSDMKTDYIFVVRVERK